MKRIILALLSIALLFSLCACAVPPKEIIIAEDTINLLTGDQYTVDYLVNPDNAKYTLTFSSSNDSVVAVENGTLTAVAPGKATITISTNNDLNKTWNIIVSDPPAMARLSSTEKAFFRILISNINSFNVPSSLRVQKVGKLSSSQYRISVKVQNRMGTTLTGTYDVKYASIKETTSSITSSDSSINVDLINAALDEFWG